NGTEIEIAENIEWLRDLLMLEFSSIKYDCQFEDLLPVDMRSGILREHQYLYSKNKNDDVITDNGLKYLFLHLMRSQLKRSSISCQQKFAALQCNATQLLGPHRSLHWLSPRMINPFVRLPDETFALP